MKVITLCGSLRFQKEMMTVAEKMALEGNCILTPVYSVIENCERTDEQLIKLKEAHFKRIELSDAIRNRKYKKIRKRNYILYRLNKTKLAVQIIFY